jgi:5-carboxymethyl-2-hydroxymuconate isomerase
VPHVIIEYSANVAEHHGIDELVEVVHTAALADGLPALDALRTRAEERTAYRIADGAESNAFVAIHARIGPGRDAEAKQNFLAAVLDAAETHLGVTPLDIAWSIELTEIDPEFRINRNHVRPAVARRAALDEQEGA